MKLVYEKQKMKSKLIFSDMLHIEPDLLDEKGFYKFFFIRSGEVELIINHKPHVFVSGEMLTLSHLHSIKIGKVDGTYLFFSFNDEFYNISGKGDEAMYNSMLFNGSPHVVVLNPSKEEMLKADALVETIVDEFSSEDSLQGEMLHILLKRLILICHRIAQGKHEVIPQHNKQFETMRKFHALVDEHFREKKQVQEYANLLHKSPKTIANILSSFHQPPAMKIIHNRIISEAKQLLFYTSKSSKEISHLLGFANHASFSRFFRIMTGLTPTEFRKQTPK